MTIDRYIIISVLFHFLFMGILGITYSTPATSEKIFNVDLVGPVDVQKSIVQKRSKPVLKKPAPPLTKAKPVLKRRRRRPPDKNILPETLLGKGTGHEQNKISPGKESDKSQDNKYIESDNALSSPKKEEGTLPEGKDGIALFPKSSLFDKKTIDKFARRSPPTSQGLTFSSEFKNRGYMKMLKERIESIWKYPKEAARLGISGDLYLKFKIKRDGSLGDVELVRTSGYRDFDEAAIKALKDGQPYWPLPDDWEKDELEINGHFIYVFGATYVM